MADNTEVHIGENSPEQVAYKLMQLILHEEKAKKERKTVLDTYAECLDAVRGGRSYETRVS